ncbi:MAG: CopG family transcriptional regulator [Prevotella sp.]|nr:CopG family transcriptional regulator [Prevotella sp.]
MEKITVNVEWCDNNFAAGIGREGLGAIIVTAPTYVQLQREIANALKDHIAWMVDDGDDVPEWMIAGDYELDYQPTASALLQSYSPDVTLSSLSRASGINKSLLSHYANGLKTPRPAQRQRIVDGLHAIGRRLLAAQ